MLSDRIKTWIEVSGFIAIIVSLLLVAYEVRQSNRIAHATITYELGRDVNDFNQLGYSDQAFANLLLLLSSEQSEYSDVQRLQIRLLANRFVNLWTVQEEAFRNGLFTREQIEVTKRDVVTVMTAFPGLHSPWKDVLESQPSLKQSDVLEPLIIKLAVH